MLNKTYMGTNDTGVQEVQKKVRKVLSNYMNKTDIKIKNRDTINTTTTNFQKTQHNILPTRGQLKYQYNDLLKGKINDPKLKNKTIQFAELLMQDTTYADLTLKTDKGGTAKLKVICCLPEHGQAFTNWWHGQEIDSPFEQLVKAFESEMKQYRIAKVIITQPPTNTGRVNKTQTNFTYT